MTTNEDLIRSAIVETIRPDKTIDDAVSGIITALTFAGRLIASDATDNRAVEEVWYENAVRQAPAMDAAEVAFIEQVRSDDPPTWMVKATLDQIIESGVSFEGTRTTAHMLALDICSALSTGRIEQIDARLDDCRTLLATIFKHVDPNTLPNYGEVLAISSRVPSITTQPSKTENGND